MNTSVHRILGRTGCGSAPNRSTRPASGSSRPRSTCTGPSARRPPPSIAGIAEQAGVTRLTVYRHFPDEVALYLACTSHWMAQQVPPDPDAWAKLADPADRLHAGLADLCRYYRQGQAMLTRTYRDLAALPESLQRAAEGIDRHYRDVLLEPFAGTCTRAQQRRLRAVLGHAVCRSGPGDRCASKAGCRTARPSRPWPPWPWPPQPDQHRYPATPSHPARPVTVAARRTTNQLTGQPEPGSTGQDLL